MSDQLVTVAHYLLAYEAELARNLLEGEGIRAFVNDDVTGTLWPSGDIRLQVGAEDAPRATALLAAQAAEASLDDDWEDSAEKGAGVWTCSLCGEPVGAEGTVCPSCQTPREAIRAAPSGIRRETPPAGDGIQTPDPNPGSDPQP
jgi:hypothetical protein